MGTLHYGSGRAISVPPAPGFYAILAPMYSVKDLLKLEVAPALGCTEPAAVALCTAAARSLLPGNGMPERLELIVDPNVYKNGMAVAIPGARGAVGIDLAAVLGLFSNRPDLKLQVLAPITAEMVGNAQDYTAEGRVDLHVDNQRTGIYIRAVLHAGGDTAEAVVENLHDNIVSLRFNGEAVTNNPLLCKTKEKRNELEELEGWLKKQSVAELIALLKELDEEDLEFIREGITVNLKLADYGLTYGPGLGVGKTFQRLTRENLLKEDMILAARILTSAASDARMSGTPLPAMSSGGSGNHGLTAILPIWAVKDYLTIPDEREVLYAVALSHIITAYVKAFTGRLSAVCGCSVAAGAGASAGIAYLMGGNIQHISGAIKNLIEDLAGVICDGAKNSCALKLATAAGTAVQSALFALHGIDVKESDGIVAGTPEQTMQNVGRLSVDGMIETDRTVLNIMIEKKFQ